MATPDLKELTFQSMFIDVKNPGTSGIGKTQKAKESLKESLHRACEGILSTHDKERIKMLEEENEQLHRSLLQLTQQLQEMTVAGTNLGNKRQNNNSGNIL